MATTVSPPADQATNLLQNLALESQTNGPDDIPNPTTTRKPVNLEAQSSNFKGKPNIGEAQSSSFKRKLDCAIKFHRYDLKFKKGAQKGKLPSLTVIEPRHFDLKGMPANDDRRTLSLVLFRGEEIISMTVEDPHSQEESRAKAASAATTDSSSTRWAHFDFGSGSVFFLLKTPSPSSPASSSSCFRSSPRDEWAVQVERIFQKKRK
ncbi:hypothetical protein FF1_004797 [Malus domestica]